MNTSEVAAVYVGAWKAGNHPSKAVADHFKIPARTAGSWIAKARLAGDIPDDIDFRKRPNKEALLVAEELGVDYQALVAAVLKHTKNGLRVVPSALG